VKGRNGTQATTILKCGVKEKTWRMLPRSIGASVMDFVQSGMNALVPQEVEKFSLVERVRDRWHCALNNATCLFKQCTVGREREYYTVFTWIPEMLTNKFYQLRLHKKIIAVCSEQRTKRVKCSVWAGRRTVWCAINSSRWRLKGWIIFRCSNRVFIRF
jgi:hypothetical protein